MRVDRASGGGSECSRDAFAGSTTKVPQQTEGSACFSPVCACAHAGGPHFPYFFL